MFVDLISYTRNDGGNNYCLLFHQTETTFTHAAQSNMSLLPAEKTFSAIGYGNIWSKITNGTSRQLSLNKIIVIVTYNTCSVKSAANVVVIIMF